ncbi:hypothetical protein VHEMI01339 [[Torrubiella] hemipterigena]|uniref:Protein CAP22 n=1 Tax=[Torrubiella] hemipterigena TaxID=1531966 RepID=A0A0A1T562_9HYPO|nr:hypothetical protein VHEMI01339 [[Torrubiella] hemipterigena]
MYFHLFHLQTTSKSSTLKMKSTLALLAGLPAAALALGIDMDDIPSACKPICKPIGTLSDRCDVDLKSDIDRDEDRLTNQCICTNKSFDVAKIAALCAACVHQSQNMDSDHKDKGDAKDIDNLLKGCGFASTSYNPTDSAAAASVTVAATAPTDISQLTTTIDGNGAQTTPGGVNLPTKTQSLITLTGENTSMAATKTGGSSGSSSGTASASSSSSAGVATMGANAAYVGAAAAAALAAVAY